MIDAKLSILALDDDEPAESLTIKTIPKPQPALQIRSQPAAVQLPKKKKQINILYKALLAQDIQPLPSEILVAASLNESKVHPTVAYKKLINKKKAKLLRRKANMIATSTKAQEDVIDYNRVQNIIDETPHGILPHALPDDVLWCLKVLEEQGYTAMVYGGVTRNDLLGNKILKKDADIVVVAPPEAIAKLFHTDENLHIKNLFRFNAKKTFLMSSVLIVWMLTVVLILLLN